MTKTALKGPKMFFPEIICVIFLAVVYFIGEEIGHAKIAPVDLNYECAKESNEVSNKSPVFLLHGLLGSKKNWKSMLEELASLTGRKVCAVDLRNHGDSPWDDETSVLAMAVDISHLLDTFQVKKAVIIGESLGGAVAMQTALDYPEKVDKIVVEDLGTRTLPPEMKTKVPTFMNLLLSAMNTVPQGSNEAQAEKIIRNYITDIMKQFNVTTEKEDAFELSLTCPDGKCRFKANLAGFLKAVQKDFDTLMNTQSGVAHVPALFIYGTKSPFKVADDKENILKMFPKAKLVPVEGANHLIHAEYPQFKEEVIKFLADD